MRFTLFLDLNRRHFLLNTLEEITARLDGSAWFTVLDCLKVFWQIKITKRTEKYLPSAKPTDAFRSAYASGVFQQIRIHLLSGIEGVECAIDDILIRVPTEELLQEKTNKVVELSSNGMMLNEDKYVINHREFDFLDI